MTYYVYILLAKDKKFYIGYTRNLEKRLSLHFKRKVRSTKFRRDLKLIHYEYFINKKDAKAREVFLKSGAGHQQIEKFLKNSLKLLR